ncbi:3,4-dihydroxy-2-butanone-4-phosphate synthase [Bacillus piscicola]|uniref:3,4-dihydroxy-2-butanone-4-phosphate synthase n=1 Tax=Bacillus piscicola TaxID=1632684 RepID=UPI001F099F2C|nr:3,4-dihydroxy-2-butanone-4-phosphate synthase [Bacillus piscicola]
MTSIQKIYDELLKGRLVVVVDDLQHHHVSYLAGDLRAIQSDHVNFMIQKGKGLVYACISEEQGKKLALPMMTENNDDTMTVSVDHYTSTTGISVNERTQTLKALNENTARPEHFIRPGHVFPVIYSEQGLLERRSVFEAVTDISRINQQEPASSYLCEILNSRGEIADTEEVQLLCSKYRLSSILLSDLLSCKADRYITCFEAKTTSIPYVNQSKGFPNLSLTLPAENPYLKTGVYGIKVHCEDQMETGIMHVNENNGEKTFDMCLLREDVSLLKKEVVVEAAFYLRRLRFFSSSSIDELVVMYEKDHDAVTTLFQLISDEKWRVKGSNERTQTARTSIS